jgi:hypothetical protein
MRLRTLLFILLILALPALACNFVNQLLEPAPTFEPPPTDPGMQRPSDGRAAPLPTPIGGDAGNATATASAGDAPTATSLDELGVPPSDPVALADWLIQAYRAQEDVVSLCNVLHASAWMADGATCETADLDGVTPDEWLLALYLEPTPDSVGDDSLQGPPGDFWIVGQSGLVYQMHGLDTSDVFGRLPELVSLVDMTGDEQDDAILLYVTCGAHTCYNNYQIVSAEGGVLRNIVDAGDESTTPELFDFISMAYVEEEQVRDATDDELDDLVISGGLIGSAGAGIQRSFTEVWAWDGSAITLAEREWEDTGYRFHRLYNANAAFEDEAYEEARTLYESVVVDPGLEEVDFTYPVEEVRAYTRQFAGFRLALLPLLRGDITEATRWQNWLSQEYSGSALSDATAILIQTWDQNGNNLPNSCDQVTNYLVAQEAPTGPLEDMGYANPSLTAVDVCPF